MKYNTKNYVSCDWYIADIALVQTVVTPQGLENKEFVPHLGSVKMCQPLSSPGTPRVILIDAGDTLEFLHATNI